MYKKTLAILITTLSLTACGGAYVEQPVQSSLTDIVVMHAPIGEPEVFFTVSYMGMQGKAVGQGKGAKEAAYDALAGMATDDWAAGTESYRAMLSAEGLVVMLTEDGTGTVYKGVVKLTVQGLEIDVVEA